MPNPNRNRVVIYYITKLEEEEAVEKNISTLESHARYLLPSFDVSIRKYQLKHPNGRPKIINDAVISQAIRMRKKGWSYHKIADTLQCSTTSILRSMPPELKGWVNESPEQKARRIKRKEAKQARIQRLALEASKRIQEFMEE
jgi:Helix-turn-helix domain of resolvase